MRNKSFTLGMESIAFQKNPAYFKELVGVITSLREVPKKELEDHELFGALAATIKHRSGVNAVLVIDKQGPAVEIPSVDRNNPLLSPLQRAVITSSDGVSMIAKAGNEVRGWVDLQKGMVGGAFAEVPIKFYFPLDLFTPNSKLTPEQTAAVILHENGHIVTYFEYIVRTVTTNAVLSGLSKALDGASGVEGREAVLLSAKKALKLQDLDEKELAKVSNKRIAEVVVVTNVIRETRSELGSNIYDATTWEALSDQYAARHGAGGHLATALATIYRGSFNISFRCLPIYLAMEAVKLLTLINPALFLLLTLLDSPSELYDTPGDRFKRIRNQVAENLRDKDLSKEDVVRLNEDLKVLDQLIASVNDRRQLLGVIWDVVSPNSRKGRNQRILQQDLEALASNDLFVAATNLKQLA